MGETSWLLVRAGAIVLGVTTLLAAGEMAFGPDVEGIRGPAAALVAEKAGDFVGTVPAMLIGMGPIVVVGLVGSLWPLCNPASADRVQNQ